MKTEREIIEEIELREKAEFEIKSAMMANLNDTEDAQLDKEKLLFLHGKISALKWVLGIASIIIILMVVLK